MANNWNFNSGSVLNMLNSQLERNAAEERMTQQLAAEAENYRKLREHQAAMQEDQQGWQSGEAVLNRGHDIFMQDDQQKYGLMMQNDMQAYETGENTKNRNLQRYLAYQMSKMPFTNPLDGSVRFSSPWDTPSPMTQMPNPIRGMPPISVPMLSMGMENLPFFASSPLIAGNERIPHQRQPWSVTAGRDLQQMGRGGFTYPMVALGNLMEWFGEPEVVDERNKYIDVLNRRSPWDMQRSRIRSNAFPTSPQNRYSLDAAESFWLNGGTGLIGP